MAKTDFSHGDRGENLMAKTYCGIRDVIDLLGNLPEKLSVERQEYWVRDQVINTECNIGLCTVIDVIFPVDGRRCRQNCWAGALFSNLLAALEWRGFVRPSRVLIRRDGRAGSSECYLPEWLQKVSDPSVSFSVAPQRGVQCEISNG